MPQKYLRFILRDLDKSNWKTFPVKNKDIKLPVQLDLFTKDYQKRAHVVMGLFYELLCVGLFGGKLADQQEVKHGIKNMFIKVDVFSRSRKKIIESKAVRSGHQLNLLDDQIDRYKVIQTLYPDYKIHYVIWRHPLRNIKSYSQSLEQLVIELCKNTLCAVILPFSLILWIHECDKFVRYENDNWDHCTRVNSSFLNLPFISPAMFFNRACVPYCDNYKIEYLKTPKMRFNDNEIDSFPIAWIKDNNYKQWAKEFSDNFIPF